MSDTHTGKQAANENQTPDVDPPRAGGMLGRLVLLAGVCLGVTAVIILVVVSLTPLADMPDDATSAPDTPWDGIAATKGVALPPVATAQATIQLQTTPAEATAQQLNQEAEELAVELLTRLPNQPDAMHVVAMLYKDLQKTTEAEKLWSECIRLAPKHAGPYVGLATAAMELGKDESAVETLELALATGCTSSDIYYQLGIALTKLGRLGEAAAVLQNGLKAYADSPEIWLQLGQVQSQLGQFAEAEQSLRQAITAGTTADSVYFALSTACARQGKQDEAARYREEFSQRKAKQAAASDERFQDRYATEMRRITAAALARGGAVYEQHGKLEEAEKLLLRGQCLEPDNLAVCGELALFYRRQKRPADALVVQRHLADIDPRNTLHFVNLASLATQVGDYDLAEAALRQVINMRPDSSIGFSGLAHLYLQIGQDEKALWFADAALRLKPATTDEIVQTSIVKAMAYQRLGDDQAASAALNVARQAAPNDPRLQPAPPDKSLEP